MRVRRLTAEDARAVSALHAGSGFAFQFPELHDPLIEAGCLILDAEDRPLAASVAKRAPEVLLAMRKDGHPALKLRALAMVHEFMREELAARGYKEANCFLPPEIEQSYGRHLQRIFGWQRSWQGYTMRGANG